MVNPLVPSTELFDNQNQEKQPDHNGILNIINLQTKKNSVFTVRAISIDLLLVTRENIHSNLKIRELSLKAGSILIEL